MLDKGLSVIGIILGAILGLAVGLIFALWLFSYDNMDPRFFLVWFGTAILFPVAGAVFYRDKAAENSTKLWSSKDAKLSNYVTLRQILKSLPLVIWLAFLMYLTVKIVNPQLGAPEYRVQLRALNKMAMMSVFLILVAITSPILWVAYKIWKRLRKPNVNS